MSKMNEAIPIDRNNQFKLSVIHASRTPQIPWTAVNVSTGRREWLRIVGFSVLAILFMAVLGTILMVCLKRKASPKLISTSSTTTTIAEPTITPYVILLERTCETYFNISLPTGTCQSASINTTDINGDGTVDIIHPDCNNNQINILFNYGNGTFTNPRIYLTGMMPSSVAVADMNEDGKSDIIITNQWSDSVSIFYNIGNDTFTEQNIYSTNYPPSSAILVDLNGDNHLDIIVAMPNTNNLAILLNADNGTFAAVTNYFLGLVPSIIITADVDNNNKLDIIVGIFKQNGPFEEYYIDILFCANNGSFTEHTKLKIRDVAYSMAVGDINGDNAVDIIVANYLTNIEIFFNTGNGTFNTKRLIDSSGFTVTKVATGDINGDKTIDIIFASAYSNKIGIFYNIDNGSSFDCLASFPINSAINYLTIADINSDKKLDIIVGTSDGIVLLSFHCHLNC